MDRDRILGAGMTKIETVPQDVALALHALKLAAERDEWRRRAEAAEAALAAHLARATDAGVRAQTFPA